MATSTTFDVVESIRQRVKALSGSRDTGPTLGRQSPTNLNQVWHLQTDIENNWAELPDDLRQEIESLFDVHIAADCSSVIVVLR